MGESGAAIVTTVWESLREVSWRPARRSGWRYQSQYARGSMGGSLV